MKEIIYTHYKSKPEKRGTLDGDTFYRDNTPLIRNHLIGLELDVIEQLTDKGCINMKFGVRKPKCKVECSLSEFKCGELKDIGIPDKRIQLCIYYKNHIVYPKDELPKV